MRIATRFCVAALAGSAMFAVPASAQLIQYTTTGFFTGGGGTPCNTALLGTGATCLYANGSGLQYNGSPVENVVNGGTSGFGSFQTMGLTQQSFAGNLFTMQIVQTSPTVGTSPNILGQITGSFSASAQGGSGGLVWTPNFNTFSVGAVNYRLFVDNTGGINIEPPRAGGVMGDPQTIRGNVSVVPEPGTYLLMASGLAGLGIMAGRRRRA